MLWKANLPRRRKALLLIMFGGGIFVTMAGILRCVLILTVCHLSTHSSSSLTQFPTKLPQNPITGAEQAGSWAVRETFVAVVTSNIPMIYPLLRRWFYSLSSSTLVASFTFPATQRTENSSYGVKTKSPSYELESKKGRKGMGVRSVNPLSVGTFTESEERIVGSDREKGAEVRTSVSLTGADGGINAINSISVTTETEVEIRTLGDEEHGRADMYNHYPDGMSKNAKGYRVYVNK